VSTLCFGTMTFGGGGFWSRVGEVGQEDANNLVGMAMDAGVNFFDTADVYSAGRSEEIIGKALASHRNEVVLATKVRGRMGPSANDVGLSRHHIIQGCEDSLRRLGTDYIDLYQVHRWDPYAPLEETLRALDDLVRQGKVRYLGCSNFYAWQLMKALALSDKHNWDRFVSLQAYYTALSRDLEIELVPVCQDQGLGIMVWSPLAGGILSGKYRRNAPRPEGARNSDPAGSFLPVDEERAYDVVEELDGIAQNHGATVAQAALNYLVQKPGVTSVIIGARTPEQLEDNLRTADWQMTPEEIQRVESVSPLPKVYPNWFLSIRRGENPRD